MNQRFNWDCAHCCLAIFLEVPISQIYLAFPKQEGIPVSNVAEYLWANNIDVDWFRAQMPTKGIKAITVVKSKTFEEKWHAIFFDGEKFVDPARNNRYEAFDEIEANLIGTLQQL